MQETTQAVVGFSTLGLMAIAAAAIAVLLILIIRVRLHPFFALVIVSIGTALATGIAVADLLPTLLSGFGKTLGNVALLIGFGAVLGRLVAVSGGARVLADTLIRLFGRDRLLPRQRLRVLAGGTLPGRGYQDHAQDLDRGFHRYFLDGVRARLAGAFPAVEPERAGADSLRGTLDDRDDAAPEWRLEEEER